MKQDQEDVRIKMRWSPELRETDFHTLLDKVIYCIIRLRREEPGTKLSQQTWATFKQLIEDNLVEVTRTFSCRWLVSVADTYADHAETPEERVAALVAVLLFWGEKVNPDSPSSIPYVTDEHKDNDGPRNLWARIVRLTQGMKVPYALFVAMQYRLLTIPGTNWNKLTRAGKRDFIDDWKKALRQVPYQKKM